MKQILLILILILISSPAWAETRTAASCSYDDVNTAYTAAEAGDTLSIPACNDGSTWSSTLTVEKAISIIGNGSTGSSKTKLIAHSTLNTGLFHIHMTTTSLVRVSGIYFDLVTSPATNRYAITLDGSMTQLRIDSNVFYGGKNQIWRSGRAFGVIHQNTFHNATTALSLEGDNDTSWADTIAAGTGIGVNTLYVEGNTFLRDASLTCAETQNQIETGQGGTFVVRYNTFDGSAWCYNECNPYSGSCVADYHLMTHGNGDCYASSVMRGHPVVEVYNNYATSNRGYHWVYRGGSVLMHDNQIVTTVQTPTIYLREEEAEGGSPFNECAKTAWPAEDQIFNSFFWNNTVNGSAMTYTIAPANADCVGSGNPYTCCSGSGAGTCDTFIVENQDFFKAAPSASGGKETLYDSGTTKFTFFDAAHKMTFSSSGANAYYPYTPYTCPHPLTGLTGSCNTAMAGTSGYNVLYPTATIGAGPTWTLGTGATTCTVTIH